MWDREVARSIKTAQRPFFGGGVIPAEFESSAKFPAVQFEFPSQFIGVYSFVPAGVGLFDDSSVSADRTFDGQVLEAMILNPLGINYLTVEHLGWVILAPPRPQHPPIRQHQVVMNPFAAAVSQYNKRFQHTRDSNRIGVCRIAGSRQRAAEEFRNADFGMRIGRQIVGRAIRLHAKSLSGIQYSASKKYLALQTMHLDQGNEELSG